MRSPCLILIAAATLLVAWGVSFAAPACASVLITVNKSTQRMTVEVDGDLRWTWPVSTGQLGHDTPSGRFTAFRMEADHFSKEWDDAPMPHSIFFTMKGHAIHGYLNTSHIGRPASHGCVRLEPDNAAMLYALVEEQGLPNTKVVLTGDVRVALGQRLPSRNRYADEDVAADDGRAYRAPPRADYRQPYGYRPASTYYRAAPGYYYAPRQDNFFRPF
jgi:L,D-transpeptidase catalytic domain